MDERFCYNAHQPINNTVIVFINTVVDHLITMPMYKIIYLQQIKSMQVQCRIVLIELYLLTCKIIQVLHPNVVW